MRKDYAAILAFGLAVGLCLSGCNGSSGSSKRGNSPPSLTLQSPLGTQRGDVTIQYTLVDGEGDTVLITVEHSTDGGVSFDPATDAGPGGGSDGVTSLPASPLPGTPHTFVWDSTADLPGAIVGDVRVRMTPRDAGVGTADTTTAFVLDNNTLVEAAVQTPSSPSAFDIQIDYTLTDADSHLCSILVDYSTDMGVTFSAASEGPSPISEGISGLTSSPTATPHVFVWSSGADLPGAIQPDVVVRIWPSDLVPGIPATTGSFSLNNNGRPQAILTTPPSPATGALTTIPGSPFTVGSSLRSMIVHPKGDFLYTGHMFGADKGARVHDIDPATGAISFSSWLDLTSLGARPGSRLAIDPPGTRLFVSDLDAGVFVADIDPVTGALTLVPGAPFSIGAFVGAFTTTVRGDYLYLALPFTSELLGFRIESTGALTAVPGSPYSVGAETLYLMPDKTDTFLFASSRVENNIRVFDISPTDGSLSQVPGSPFPNSNTDPLAVMGPLWPFP